MPNEFICPDLVLSGRRQRIERWPETLGAPAKSSPPPIFGFSLFYFFASFRLKMGNLKNPGPGLIPIAIGFLAVAFTALHLFRVFRELPPRGEREEAPAAEGKNYRAIAGVLICTAVYPFLLEPLKFILSTLTASFVMLTLLKPGKYLFSFLRNYS